MSEQDFNDHLDRVASPFMAAFLVLFAEEIEPRYSDDRVSVWMSSSKLLSALRSYLIDIGRMVDFHHLKVADDPKKATYLVKWLLKEKPIMYQGNPRKEHAVLNEIFALRVATLILRVGVQNIPEETRALIIYTMRYRHYEPDGFLVFFDHLWRTAENGKPKAVRS